MNKKMKRISIFCGSSSGKDEIYKKQAFLLGQTLAKQNIEIVYGGATLGLMGAVAEGALSEGGKVIGVITEFLEDKEIAHKNLAELIIVKSMSERKIKIDELSDGVIALPGGFGTLDELFEMLTSAQLGFHKKPIAILNINGYYDALNRFLENMTKNGFLKETNKKMLLKSNNIEDLLEKMNNYVAVIDEKWIVKD